MTRRTLTAEVRATLVLAAPIIVSQFAQVSLGLVDTVTVGVLGKEALAGVALGSAVFFAIVLVFLGVVLAVEPLVAQAFGADDADRLRLSVWSGLWAAVLMSVPALAVLYGAAALLTHPALGQDPATAQLAAAWLRAVMWGVPGFLGFGALRAFCEGVSRPLSVTVIALAGVGLHVLLNVALVFGRFGAPALGVVGAGYASAISSWGIFLALAGFIQFWPDLRRYAPLRIGRPEWTTIREVFRVGLPVGGSFFIEAGLFSATALLIGRLGSVELAAHQIAIQCASVTFMGALGTGLAGAVRVGQAAGRGDADGVRCAGFTSMGLAVAFMALAATGYLLFAPQIAAFFLDPADPANADAVRLAVTLLGIAGVFQVFDGLQVASTGALRGLKDTRAAMLVGLVCYWGIGLTTGSVLAFTFGLGAPGLWWGLVVGLAAAAAGLSTRFYRRTRTLRYEAAVEQ